MSLLRRASPRTIYLVARVHGLGAHLFKPEEMVGLTRVPDLTTLMQALLKSDYASALSKIPTEEVNAIRLAEVFCTALSDRFYFIPSITGGSVRRFFEDYARRLEVENVKRILRVKSAGESIDERALVPIPREYATVNFSAMVGSKGFEECVGLLRATIYSPLEDRLGTYKQFGSALVYEGLLDSIYYGRLWDDVEALHDDDVRERIGLEMDLQNLLLILKLKSRDISQDIIEKSIIETRFRLSGSAVGDLVGTKAGSAFDALMRTNYAKYFSELRNEIQDGLLSKVEHFVMGSLYHQSIKTMVAKPLGLAYVLAYLSLCEFEEKNITAIATGKQLGLSDDRLFSLLYV
jgi:vacuolar-type H+-ATPase subunit C/Vma6